VSEIEIIEVLQGSPDWEKARLGLVTASNASKVMAGGDGKVRNEYLRKLCGEQVSRLPAEQYRSNAMSRGNQMEPEIRSLYHLVTGREPLPVSADASMRFEPGQPGWGFVKRRLSSGGFIGSSPDARVIDHGAEGGIEIKSAAPHILIDIMQRGTVPTEHLPQCQCTMLVNSTWQFVDLVIGYSGMPPFIRRIRRDTAHIARLEVGINQFNKELAEMVDWVRNFGKQR
jgi:hypothetical protein